MQKNASNIISRFFLYIGGLSPFPTNFVYSLQTPSEGHMPEFDFHAKHVFLTYPQCGAATADDALPILAGLGEGRVSFVVVSREQHEDGGNHLHSLICFKVRSARMLSGFVSVGLSSLPRRAFGHLGVTIRDPASEYVSDIVVFQRKFRTRNIRYFDLELDGRTLHPNIQPARNITDVYTYVTKEGDFTETGDKPSKLLPPGQSKPSKRDAAFAALDDSTTTVEEFMSELRTKHPYEFFTRGNTIKANVEQVKRRRWVYESPSPPTVSSYRGRFKTGLIPSLKKRFVTMPSASRENSP